MTGKTPKRVCVGAFAGAHGVKGAARVKTFTEKPENIAAYGPVETEDGARRFTLTVLRKAKPGVVLVSAPEIKSREDAEALKGARLYADRDRLPPPDEEEFYLDDLVGLSAIDEAGAPLGRVKAVYNFGAGDLIELSDIPGVKGLRAVPFTKTLVPRVDIAAGKITVLREAVTAGEDEDNPLADEDFIDAELRERDA